IAGAPTTLQAGQVVELANVTQDFLVRADHAFSISTVQPSSVGTDTTGMPLPTELPLGDPSLSVITAIEQYRTRYVFLAPDDYLESFADVAAPADAALSLD